MDISDFEAYAALKGEETLRVRPDRTALLVVDMQRYFVEPEFPFGQVLAKFQPDAAAAYFDRVRTTVVPNVQELLKSCRKLGIPTYFTAFGSLRSDGRDLPGWARQLNKLSQKTVGAPMYPPRDDDSWQIHATLAPRQGEPVLAKTTSGPLNSARLDQTLHVLGVDTVLVAGVTTDVCVTQAARELADGGFSVIILADSCAAPGDDRHRSALETFAMVFGRVCSTRSVLEALEEN